MPRRYAVRPTATPSAGRGTPRRWPATSSGRSSSAATGWARCRRRRWCTASPSRRPSRSAPRSQTRWPGRAATRRRAARRRCACSVATWRCRCCGVVVGDLRRDRVPRHQLVEPARRPPAMSLGLAGLEDRPQLALELAQQHAVAVGGLLAAATAGRRGTPAAPSTSERSAFSSAAAASAYRMKSTIQSYGASGERADRRDPVHREGAHVVAAVVVRGERCRPRARPGRRPARCWCPGCRRSRSARSSPVSIASRSAAIDPLGVSRLGGRGGPASTRPGRRRGSR